MTRDRALTALLAAAVFGFGSFIAFSYPAHHDLAWLLHVAAAVLDGAGLYTEVVEVNPPLIIWLGIPAELLARAFGAWNLAVYRALVLAAAAVSILLVRRQLRAYVPAPAPLAIDLLTLLLCYLFTARPGIEFGQREHLAVILTLPFLLSTARPIHHGDEQQRTDIVAADVAAGVMAGIGFAIKPHFLVAWLAVQLYVLLRRPRAVASFANGAVLIVFLVYAGALLLLARDWFALARLGVGAYTRMSLVSPGTLLMLPPALWTIAAVVIGGFARGPLRDVFRVTAAATAGFLIAVLLQGKGWAYHWIACTTLAAVLLPFAPVTWVAPRVPLRRLAAAQRIIALAAAAALLALATRKLADAEVHWSSMRGRAYQLPQMIEVIERYAGPGPVAALSTNMQAAFPLVSYTDVDWALRFNSLWLLPGSYPEYEPGTRVRYHPVDSMPAVERYMFDAVIEDLVRTRPTLIILDRVPPGYLLQGFDYLEYFGRDPRFAELLRGYGEAPPVERYRILVRIPARPP